MRARPSEPHPADPAALQASVVATRATLGADEFDRPATLSDSSGLLRHGTQEHEMGAPATHDHREPAAPESAQTGSGTRGDEPAVPDTAQVPHRHGIPSAAYACPMHPEVTSSQPARCTKCGMMLVERKGKR
jgi:hypothetical protein